MQPTQHVLSNNDALIFYGYAAKLPAEIANRKSISDVARKFGIIIDFEYGGCKRSSCKPNHIRIYNYTNGKNQSFFRHLRNAFAHLYIEISGGRCSLLDWNPYKSGMSQSFKTSLITMHGDVDYDSFKKMLQEFFSKTTKTNKR